MKAKKSYGQHFLNRPDIAERIAHSLIHTDQYRRILEVGPGQGMLTQHLLRRDLDLIVVEADRDMVLYLNKNYPQLKERIVSADFLKVDLKALFHGESFGLIGNFPYNISSQILFRMLDYKEQIPEMVGMFQKEVADRVAAGPGSKIYGVISVLIQVYYEPTYLFTVEKESFSPPPKVRSAVIRLTRKAKPETDCSPSLFKRVVKQAFSQRRKMLRNTMKAFIKNDPILDQEFFKQRPEQLSIAEFAQLTQWIEERIKN
ncbi:MAG: 16S rRNA (adenine(1518)-N(6)/adenine(1519)-N(6))-dimethyltransferase RsmA [Bacteroidota bacterium]